MSNENTENTNRIDPNLSNGAMHYRRIDSECFTVVCNECHLNGTAAFNLTTNSVVLICPRCGEDPIVLIDKELSDEMTVRVEREEVTENEAQMELPLQWIPSGEKGEE